MPSFTPLYKVATSVLSTSIRSQISCWIIPGEAVSVKDSVSVNVSVNVSVSDHSWGSGGDRGGPRRLFDESAFHQDQSRVFLV